MYVKKLILTYFILKKKIIRRKRNFHDLFNLENYDFFSFYSKL